MRLDKVEITNFRSIKQLTIDFDPQCRILVGINETGKSNILKALSLLDSELEIKPEDVRNSNPDEETNLDTLVRFIFALDKNDREAIYKRVLGKVLLPSPTTALVETTTGELDLRACVDLFDKGLYDVELKSRSAWYYHALNSDVHTIKSNLKKPSKSCPQDYQIQLKDGKQIILKQFGVLSEDFAESIPMEYIENVSVQDLRVLITSSLRTWVEDNLPTCIFWFHSDENLLPGQIVRDDFVGKPESCKPLKFMFSLSGIAKPGEAITNSLSKPNGLRNLLKRVADSTNKHLKSVWKEYKGIEIELLPNGDYIDATVKDVHNNYNLALRSDGFRRFITFLLMVSARVKTKELSNTLLLYDEPEISLHPSGARYLRDELIKISQSNYVVFSTHSIFMIDKDRIDRHLLITKKNEITMVEEANESNILDEEVVYKALGYSVFDDLKKINIVFEGWRDKELFKVALKSLPASHKSLKRTFDGVGLCHVKGVKDVARITPMLELAEKSYLIISDGDSPAREQQKKYKAKEWFRYDELISSKAVFSAEDFITAEAYKDILSHLTSENSNLGKLVIEDLKGEKPKIEVLSSWLQKSGIVGESQKQFLNRIKSYVFENLKPSQIELKYFDIIQVLSQKLGEIQNQSQDAN